MRTKADGLHKETLTCNYPISEPLTCKDDTFQKVSADWKTALQNLVSERRLPQPEYETSSVGPDHDLVFTAIARVDEAELGTGKGPSKKQAEQQAARVAFHALRDNVTTLPDA